MTLQDAINHYIAWRQAHGAKYESSCGRILHLFLKSVDGETNCNAVTTAQVLAFLAGKGPLTRHRENKYGALAGFYRYAISRGYANTSPLPDNEPKPPVRRRPTYTPMTSCGVSSTIEPCRSVGEERFSWTRRPSAPCLYFSMEPVCALERRRRLTLADVDLSGEVLTIRDTKFYKSRLVPIGPQSRPRAENVHAVARDPSASARAAARSFW